MIRYRLVCSRNHEFDAWFASSSAYDSQEKAGHLSCPQCGDSSITRAVMAPRISRSAKHGSSGEPPGNDPHAPPLGEPNSGMPASPHAAPALRPRGSEGQRLKSALSELHALREKILSKSEYVGPRFSEEARRIHHEEAPDRAIHGEATAEEVRELVEDGIEVAPIPRLPEDGN